MQIKFSYPRRGLTGQFNTFRLGLKLSEQLHPGDLVELVDSRTDKLLKRAIVKVVHTGTLTDMAQLHAAMAHNWKEHPKEQQADLLVASMKKRYQPGRVRDDSKVSVVYLEEVHERSSCD